MSLRTDYDIWHSRYHELDTSYDDTSSPWYQWVRESMDSAQGLRTLEVACGRGGFVRALSRKGAQAYGLDFSFTAIAVGKGRAQSEGLAAAASFVQGDAHALPFPDDFFDLLVSCETIEHLPSPRQAMSEFYRVTKPGGLMYLTTPNYLNLMGLYEIYAKIRHPQRKPDQPYDRLQLYFQTRHLLQRAGWKILRADGVVHQLPIVPGRNPIQIEIIERKPGLRKLLRNFAYHYCMVAQKG